MPLCGKPALEHVLDRISRIRLIDRIVVVTTTSGDDDPVVELAGELGYQLFRGSGDDILSLYYHAALKERLEYGDAVVRFTADCPLLDRRISTKVIQAYNEHMPEVDNVTNGGGNGPRRTYPQGIDTEVFSFLKLAEAHRNAAGSFRREHVTPYIYETGRTMLVENETDYSHFRLNLDTLQDYRMISAVYEELYNSRNDFGFDQVIELLEVRPDIADINSGSAQKNGV